MTLQERVALALGWEESFQKYHVATLPSGVVTEQKYPVWRDPRGVPNVSLPDPEDANAVEQLVRKAIEKDVVRYQNVLVGICDKERPDVLELVFAVARATIDQRLEAALRVLEDSP